MSDEPKDLWDHQDQYNVEPQPPTLKQPKSELSKVHLSKEVEDAFKKAFKEILYGEPKPFVPLTVESLKASQKEKEQKALSTMAEKYRKAFKTVYDSFPKFKQIEVDNFTKGDNLPLTSREKDFAQRVASLAEKS
jgi:hypothetical protein